MVRVIHHLQVEKELEECRKILKKLILIGSIDRNDLPIESLSLSDTSEILIPIQEGRELNLEQAKEIIDQVAISRHPADYAWKLENDKEQRDSMNENLKIYEKSQESPRLSL